MPDGFGIRLKQLRILRGFTMEELGKEIGVAKTTISGYEHGNREPQLKIIYKLATTLNTTADYLLGLSALAEPHPLLESKESSASARNLHWDGHILTEEDLLPIHELLEKIVKERLQQPHKAKER